MINQLLELRIEYEGVSYKLSTEQRCGTGSLVVFLHGWGGSKDSFAGAFSSKALRKFDICTIDLLGFGRSEKSEDFSYDLLDHANVVALAINSFKAKKVYLVGHSMGGGIGLLAAPLVKNLATFINAESNLAPHGSAVDARVVAGQSFRLFRASTLPLLKTLLRRHPKRRMRIWAEWFDKASPLALHRSVQSLVDWSDSGKLLPLFSALPHKAYIYGAKGKRRKDVVPKLDKNITYEIPASGHALMNDNSDDFYDTVAKIIRTL